MSSAQVSVTERGVGRERPEPSEVDATARDLLLETIPSTERRLNLNQVQTAVLEGGEGPPIVLLHGLGAYAAQWFRVIPDLAATNRVVAPDLPGHGATGAPDETLDVDSLMVWLNDLIECTCESPPVLVGHNLGGAIAAHFAARHGERIERLILVDALGLEAFRPRPEFKEALMAFVAKPGEETHDRLWRRCAYDLPALRNAIGDSWRLMKAYNLDRAFNADLQAVQRELMESVGIRKISPSSLESISVLTSLIWGRHDLATPLQIAEATSARYGWPLYVIEDAADDPAIERPEPFLDALRVAMRVDADKASASTQEAHRSAWDRIAPGFDRTNTPTQMKIAAEGLRRAGLRPGAQFLDVASGSGAMSIPAARLGAYVLATDQSPVMLELLGSRARAEGLDIETRVMDGHALQIPDESFDVAGSQFGVMLFEDVTRAIREMVRVIRPGGRVVINAYGHPDTIDFLQFFVRAVQSVRPLFTGLPTDPPPLEFQLADPDRMAVELSSAGLKNVEVEVVTETTTYRTGNDLWEWIIWSNPIAEALLSDELRLTGEEREAARQVMEELVRDRADGGDAAVLANPVNIGIGTK